MSAGPNLHIENLGVHYRQRTVLCGVDLHDIQPGQLIALAGPNAAGKSTLLKAIAGLVTASGQIRYGHENWSGWSAGKRVPILALCPRPLRKAAT
ncbi:ATP-binding cassette domain-containing protein [Advenella kashmirensis]|uniref:ATP-binding cassette domain-containing protein n=1 Tax=Advenella kashmirensis TaxID=310575 RepID=UPI0014949FC6|nr:ATP-binding cassette domain-containing protein [Advenella kashmirensis]